MPPKKQWKNSATERVKKMSNSTLAKYTKLSPNCTKPRNHAIDTITIHCMAGNCSIETCGEIFAPASRQASSNYGVGSDGRIALYVDEANRSWCTSSASNDNRAVTIEVANNGGAPDWPVSDKAYTALLDLVTDICKRNGIKKLLWKGDKNLIGQVDKQNMTVHRWFASKTCPGDYLYNRHASIAEEVNKRLNAGTTQTTGSGTVYYVQTGAFSNKVNADAQLAKVKAAGFDAIMKQSGNLYRVQVGAYSQKPNADAMAAKLKAAGFDTYITTTGGTQVAAGSSTPSAPVRTIGVGSKVEIKSSATKYSTGQAIPDWVKGKTYTVQQLGSGKVLLKEILSWIDTDDVTLA